MRTIARTLLPLFAALILAASCVHQWPESTPADFALTLSFDSELPYYKTVQFPDETKSGAEDLGEFAQDFTDYEKYDVRYTIEAYSKFSNGDFAHDPAKRWVFTEDDASHLDDYTVNLSVDEGVYEFRAWVDFVKAGSAEDYIYVTSNWRDGIKVNDADGHHGNTDWKDAYSGKVTAEVIRYGSIAEPGSAHLEMARPLGKYIFVTTDLDEFIIKELRRKAEETGFTEEPEFNIEDYTLTIAYTGFMPSSYSMLTDRANDSEVNVRFTSSLKQINETTAIMGFDYVLANPKTAAQTSIIMGVELKYKDGTVLSSHNSARIPVQRSEYTVVEGRFLMQESSGGITLNPDFDGEFVVPVY